MVQGLLGQEATPREDCGEAVSSVGIVVSTEVRRGLFGGQHEDIECFVDDEP